MASRKAAKAAPLTARPGRNSVLVVQPSSRPRLAGRRCRRRCHGRTTSLLSNVEFDLTGKKISKQAFAIAPKIAEVDKLMLARGKNAKPCVREVHPELCFWGLNRGNPLTSKKKRVAGRKDRLRVLQSVEGRAEEIFNEACGKFQKKVADKEVARDDILDALAAAVVARHGQGKLQSVPKVPQKDPMGLPMEMVYYLP